MASKSSSLPLRDWCILGAFSVIYVLLDWVSFMDPLFALNITPWNPDPAISLVFWLRYGWRTALPGFVALALSEILVRGMPAGLTVTLLLSLQLTIGYGLTGEVLRRVFSKVTLVNTRERLFNWLAVVFIGLGINGLGYIGSLYLAGLVPHGAFSVAAVRFITGDIVGVVMCMPLVWLAVIKSSRPRLLAILRHREAAGYIAFAAFLVWGVFEGKLGTVQYKHLYFLFMPIVWAASRHGVVGAGLVAFTLQAGIIVIVRWFGAAGIPFTELQLLGAALSLVGFFIGVIVDEQRQAAEGLKQSLRLAAAGEMAAALAHELNQPLAALAAYGKACEHMIARGGNEALLRETIAKMVREAGRASDVVRRLREFFRTGAMHLEVVAVADVVDSVTRQFDAACRTHAIELRTDVARSLSVKADRLQLELVLRNLIANAVDAVAAVPPPAPRRIVVRAARQQGGRLEMSVEDSGAGVSRDVAGRLFEPFVSGKSSGLGLGLVLSRTIVEAHGGSLWAEVGRKGLFKLMLPLLEMESQACTTN